MNYYCFAADAPAADDPEVFKEACFLPAFIPVDEADELLEPALTFFDEADA